MRCLAAVPILLASTAASAEPASILPSAVVQASTSLDSDGRPSAGARVGLGGVAEYGIRTLDLGLTRTGRTKASSRPYLDESWRHGSASFRMGIAEDRLFAGQPAVALGFEKTFAQERDGVATRAAALTLVASRHVAPGLQVHAGAVLWDASIERDGATPTYFHDQALEERVRGIGGVEAALAERTRALADVSWRPHLAPGHVHLEPVLAIAVRHDATDTVGVQPGVRVAGDDVTVVVEAIVTTTRLRRVIDRAR